MLLCEMAVKEFYAICLMRIDDPIKCYVKYLKQQEKMRDLLLFMAISYFDTFSSQRKHYKVNRYVWYWSWKL